MQLAGYYNRQGEFDKTIDALAAARRKEPTNPEAFYTMATYYWDKAFRDNSLKEPEKKKYIQKGLEAVDKAIQLKPDYMEALVYKGLLLRLQATIEKDAEQAEGPAQGSRRVARQGPGHPEDEDRRRGASAG